MGRYMQITGLGLLLVAAAAWADMADVEGRWLTQNKEGWIRLQIVGDMLEGSIAGAPPGSPGKRDFDDRNPDPALRSRRLDGLVIMTGFEYAGKGRWKNGKVYDPDSGNTYKCTARLLDPDTLKIKGYIGIPLLGRSEIWTRDDPGPEGD
ncbi:MAG: DUF2147 domain-containing protein [Woeseiaceae bacterium]|nr:DUF2147 domain-containing protein [Woeseiaceae bacterium]